MAMVEIGAAMPLAHELGGEEVPRPYQHPISDAMRAEVIVAPEYPPGRGPDDCPSVLRLVKGDIVYVLEKHESGWWGGHKEGDEATGWFPGSVAMEKPLGDSVDYDGDDENSRALERDHRAVASPQGSHRARQGANEQQEKLVQELAAEHNKVKELENAVALEREFKEKFSEDVRRLEAEISRVRTERDGEKQERERERRERELREKDKSKQEQHLQAQERKESEALGRSEQEASDLRKALRNSGQEVTRLQEELASRAQQVKQAQADLSCRDEVIGTMQAQMSAGQPPRLVEAPQPSISIKQRSPVKAPRDDRRPVDASMVSEKSQALIQTTPQGSGGRDDATCRSIGRQASSSITRQLFTQPVADDAPLVHSARGGLNRHTSDPSQSLQGLTASSLCGMSNALPAGVVRVVSAQPPRPSPRATAVTHPATASALSGALSAPVQPWRSHSQGAPVAASPRGGKAIAAMQGIESRGGPPAVRAIVSEIERRSTSQTPGVARSTTTYEGAATPTRPIAMATATTRAASATVPCASSRAAQSHAMQCHQALTVRAAEQQHQRGRRQDCEEVPHHSPTPRQPGSEDHSGSASAVVFGMSPMNRPRTDRQLPHGLRAGIASPSPSPKGPSVQERIRAFQRL